MASPSPACGPDVRRHAIRRSSKGWKVSARSDGRSCWHDSAGCAGLHQHRSTILQTSKAFHVSWPNAFTHSCMASPSTSRAITFNIPMALTWARIAMIPLVVGIYYLPDAWLVPHWKNVAACWLFIVAAITDALDGYL